MTTSIRIRVAATLLAAAFASPASAAIIQLIVNGGFETGNFTGWTLANRPLGAQYDPNVPAAGSFVIDDADNVSPLSGLQTLGPKTGSFYAISDMTAQGTHALLQSFVVPLGVTSIALSFDMYVFDWAGAGGAIDPSGLDHTSGGTGQNNQHARVDLLLAGATAFDTSPAAVLANFYIGVDPEAAAGQDPFYRPYLFNITGLTVPGQTYQLRFGEVDNEFVLNQAVDNVSIVATLASGSVSEPAIWQLLLVGSLLLLILRRRARIAR